MWAGPPFVSILLVMGTVAVALAAMGLRERRPALVGGGLLLAGFAVVAADLMWYLSRTPLVAGEYALAASDLLSIAFLGFLGGALAMLGASYVAVGRAPPR